MTDIPVEKPISLNNEVTPEAPKVYTAEDFTEEFNAIVKRTGFTISFEPALIPRDDSTYSIIVKQAIVTVKKE